jgi:hypothetical protein
MNHPMITGYSGLYPLSFGRILHDFCGSLQVPELRRRLLPMMVLEVEKMAPIDSCDLL